MSCTTGGIRDLGIAWPAGQVMRIPLVVTLSPGRVLSDWASFSMTLREDPDYPRKGADLLANPDPLTDGWAIAAQDTAGVADPNPGGSTITFTLTMPTAAGVRRYVVDACGVGGVGLARLFTATWVTITPGVT